MVRDDGSMTIEVVGCQMSPVFFTKAFPAVSQNLLSGP